MVLPSPKKPNEFLWKMLPEVFYITMTHWANHEAPHLFPSFTITMTRETFRISFVMHATLSQRLAPNMSQKKTERVKHWGTAVKRISNIYSVTANQRQPIGMWCVSQKDARKEDEEKKKEPKEKKCPWNDSMNEKSTFKRVSTLRTTEPCWITNCFLLSFVNNIDFI